MITVEQQWIIDQLRHDLGELVYYFNCPDEPRYNDTHLIRKSVLLLHGLRMVKKISPTIYRYYMPLKIKELGKLVREERRRERSRQS